jgi:phosphoglycerate dehydrogenase-like enzyme
MDNVILTPRIAAGIGEALRVKMRSIFASLQRCADGKRIQDRVV